MSVYFCQNFGACTFVFIIYVCLIADGVDISMLPSVPCVFSCLCYSCMLLSLAAHDRDETVRVTLCQARPGGAVDPVAEERFQFVHDLALDMAHFLISAAAHRDGLEGALLLADSHIPVQECERLDETLTLALKHLPLPPGWSVVGPDINTHSPAGTHKYTQIHPPLDSTHT